MNKGQLATLIGGAGLIIGAILPWAEFGTNLGVVTKPGYQAEGLYTGAIGILLLMGALLIKGRRGKRYSIVGTILSAVAALISLYDLYLLRFAVSALSSGQGMNATLGVGLYVSLVAALIGFVGGLFRVPDR